MELNLTQPDSASAFTVVHTHTRTQGHTHVSVYTHLWWAEPYNY